MSIEKATYRGVFMEKSYFELEKLIGKTPLVRLCALEKYFGLKSRIFAKVESRNPTGSVKDRAALYIIRAAERERLLGDGGTLVDATSGNMGISLAMLSAVGGYRAIITMPRSSPPGRANLMRAYGAEVAFTDGTMADAIDRAKELSGEIKGSFYPNQFKNPNNALAHFYGTGREIYREMQGLVDIFVCGIGSSGTFSGVARYLKEKNVSVKTLAVEPLESSVLSCGEAGTHKIYGIGAGFVPPLFESRLCDRIDRVQSDEARVYCEILTKKEGILVGPSSGAALCSAVREARVSEGKNIVTIFPDGGERYI